jgi:hypothetical protein
MDKESLNIVLAGNSIFHSLRLSSQSLGFVDSWILIQVKPVRILCGLGF